MGHNYDTTGNRYLLYLKDKGLENSKGYKLTLENIEQGKHYWDAMDYSYRENEMSKNFIREYDQIKDEKIMGIFGGSHIALDSSKDDVKTMADQLEDYYGNTIFIKWLYDVDKFEEMKNK